MITDLPSAWAQQCPRSVRLAPERLLVPAETLRRLLQRHGSLELVCAGFGMEPSLRDGRTVIVEADGDPHPGDIVLCDIEGWGDLLRLRKNLGAAGWEVGLDAFPRRHAIVANAAVLGVLGGADGGRCRRMSRRLAVALGFGALRFEWGRIRQAPHFGRLGTQSVGDKYRDQVAEYRRMRVSNLEDRHLAALRRGTPQGGGDSGGGLRCGRRSGPPRPPRVAGDGL